MYNNVHCTLWEKSNSNTLSKVVRERGREGEREGERERGRERKRGREGGRKRGREGEREWLSYNSIKRMTQTQGCQIIYDVSKKKGLFDLKLIKPIVSKQKDGYNNNTR